MLGPEFDLLEEQPQRLKKQTEKINIVTYFTFFANWPLISPPMNSDNIVKIISPLPVLDIV